MFLPSTLKIHITDMNWKEMLFLGRQKQKQNSPQIVWQHPINLAFLYLTMTTKTEIQKRKEEDSFHSFHTMAK